MKNENSLIVIEANKMNLEPEAKKTLLDSFTNYFEEAEKLKSEALAIKVESINQLEDMQKARMLRLRIKPIRIEVEKTRKRLKADSLRTGNAIDGFANIIKLLIEPIEKHLQDQEDFIKLIKEKELIEFENKRISELSKYVDNVDCFDLKLMTEDAYKFLLESSTKQFNECKAAEEKAEKDRIELEEKKSLYQSRKDSMMIYGDLYDHNKLTINSTNEQFDKILFDTKALKIAKDKQQRKIADENEKLKKEAGVIEKEREKQEKEIADEKALVERQHQEKLHKEKAERLKIEAELQEKKDEERRIKLKNEKNIEQEKEKERQASLAPDKDKLNALALSIVYLIMPEVKDPKAKKIIEGTVELLNKTSSYIKKEIVNL